MKINPAPCIPIVAKPLSLYQAVRVRIRADKFNPRGFWVFPCWDFGFWYDRSWT